LDGEYPTGRAANREALQPPRARGVGQDGLSRVSVERFSTKRQLRAEALNRCAPWTSLTPVLRGGCAVKALLLAAAHLIGYSPRKKERNEV